MSGADQSSAAPAREHDRIAKRFPLLWFLPSRGSGLPFQKWLELAVVSRSTSQATKGPSGRSSLRTSSLSTEIELSTPEKSYREAFQHISVSSELDSLLLLLAWNVCKRVRLPGRRESNLACLGATSLRSSAVLPRRVCFCSSLFLSAKKTCKIHRIRESALSARRATLALPQNEHNFRGCILYAEAAGRMLQPPGPSGPRGSWPLPGTKPGGSLGQTDSKRKAS